jgi:uncharacterized protein
MSETEMPTARTRVVREADRAVYDREAAYRILDEGFLCHVGFVAEGQPFVIPTSYGREGDSLYIHGSAASRMVRQMKDGVAICVTVTLLDGLVLARSVFNHSMNYRSVVILWWKMRKKNSRHCGFCRNTFCPDAGMTPANRTNAS